jgi:polyisoprenoid-binding protein YceI
VRTYIFVALLAAAFALPAAAEQETYTVDPAHTYPSFEVNHLGFSTSRGMFTRTTGKIVLDRANKTGSIDITIDTRSLFTGDERRDKHLRADDFFHVEMFPEMTYRSNTIRFRGDNPVAVEGELTLLGVTRPVSLGIDSFNCGTHPINRKPVCGADATATIKRSEFGMDAYVPAVGDQVTLRIGIEAFRE